MRIDAKLTQREQEIAELLAWGAAKKEVAARLNISVRTVENTARNIYGKLDIQKATELCVWWFCTRCGVSFSLSPLKRSALSILLLLVLLPYEIHANKDFFRIGSSRAKVERVTRSRSKKETEGFYLEF